MARRHLRGLVVRSTPHHEGACHRHHCLLFGDEQHDLTRPPEILRAGHRHHRIVCRGAPPSTALASIDVAVGDPHHIGVRDRPARDPRGRHLSFAYVIINP
ncbi:hypothetical protein ACFVFI_37645, partial [Streptomyces sp. NPDC057705]